MQNAKIQNEGAESAFVAFGANLPSRAGDPVATFHAVVADLEASGVRVVAKSRLFQTPAFPEGSGPDYINACIEIETAQCAQTLLATLHEVEARFGRVRKTRWAERGVDLDLIAVGERVLPDEATLRRWIEMDIETQMRDAPETLTLPHPRLQDRAFVLIPFADVAPDWRHPVLGLTVKEMCAARPESEKSAIIALK